MVEAMLTGDKQVKFPKHQPMIIKARLIHPDQTNNLPTNFKSFSIFATLEEFGLPPTELRFIQALYYNSFCDISIAGATYPGFNLEAGVRQGCPLCPLRPDPELPSLRPPGVLWKFWPPSSWSQLCSLLFGFWL